MASQHEDILRIQRVLDTMKDSVERASANKEAQVSELLTSNGALSHVLNVNNFRNNYRIPNLPLNSVYNKQQLPVTVGSGNYDDTQDVDLNYLQSLTDKTRNLNPTSTLYQGYIDRGMSRTKAIEMASREFRNENEKLAQNDSLFTGENESIQGFDDVSRRVGKVVDILRQTNNISTQIRDASRANANRVENLFRLTPEFFGENEFGLNGIYSPVVIPTRAKAINYDDTKDVNLSQLQDAFNFATFRYRVAPTLTRRYGAIDPNAITTQVKIQREIADAIQGLNQKATIDFSDFQLQEFTNQMRILEDSANRTFRETISLLYEQTAIASQLPDTVSFIISKFREQFGQAATVSFFSDAYRSIIGETTSPIFTYVLSIAPNLDPLFLDRLSELVLDRLRFDIGTIRHSDSFEDFFLMESVLDSNAKLELFSTVITSFYEEQAVNIFDPDTGEFGFTFVDVTASIDPITGELIFTLGTTELHSIVFDTEAERDEARNIYNQQLGETIQTLQNVYNQLNQ